MAVAVASSSGIGVIVPGRAVIVTRGRVWVCLVMRLRVAAIGIEVTIDVMAARIRACAVVESERARR